MKNIQQDMQLEEEAGLRVGGYEFTTAREAQEAQKELRNIQALKGKIDFNKKKEVLEIYKRLIDKRAFRTPVGLQFMGEFRDYLIDTMKCREEDVPTIPIPASNGRFREEQEQVKLLQIENERMHKKSRYMTIAITALIVTILAMFAITAWNPNVGYINTENKILNRYAGWEEELTNREKQIQEKERELGITTAPTEEPTTEETVSTEP